MSTKTDTPEAKLKTIEVIRCNPPDIKPKTIEVIYRKLTEPKPETITVYCKVKKASKKFIRIPVVRQKKPRES